MKFTSKISLIIAIALLISVGSVYAAWTYVEYQFSAANKYSEKVEANLEPSQTNTITTSKTGTINVTGGYTGLMLDQLKNDVIGQYDYHGKLIWTGEVAKVSFARSNAPTAEGENAAPETIDILVTIKIQGTNLCDEGHQILQLVDNDGNDAITLVSVDANTATITLNDVGADEVEFDLADYIQLNSLFELPTLDKYNAVKENVNSIYIDLTMEDMTVASVES